MSVRIMSLIFEADFDQAFPKGETVQENTIRVSTAKLVCLALADHANDDGKGAYPSIDRLERKTGLSRRSIQYTIEGLKEARIIHYEGKSEYGTNDYSISISRLIELIKNPPPIYGGASSAYPSQGVQVMHPRDASDAQKDVSLAHEPSFKPSINHGAGFSKNEKPARASRTSEELKAQTQQSIDRFYQRAKEDDFSWLTDGLVHYARVFVKAFGYAPAKDERNLWRKVLLKWQEMGFTDDIITQTVSKMKQQGLTIAGPQSVTNMARSAMLSTQGQMDLPPVFQATEEQRKAYKERFGN